MFVATPAVIASVIIFVSPVTSASTLSAVKFALKYCATTAVELSPFDV